MKKYISVLMLIVLLAACTQVANRSSQQHTTVAPLPSGLDVAHLADATVAARFDVNQIDWDRGTISMGIFVEDRYDAAEISQLAVGDTLAFEGCGIVVDSIRFEGDCVCINGGIEFGGADLVADDGGTYRGRMMDDHGTYSCIGNVELELADDAVLTDCGDEPTSPSVTISKEDIREYLGQDSVNKDFFCLNTTVRIAGGKIVNITRRWIP